LGNIAHSFNAFDMFCPVSGYSQFSGTFYGVRIYFCHTTRTSLSTTFADNYSGNTPVLVVSRDSLPLNWTEGQWGQIGFDNPFNYNGTDNSSDCKYGERLKDRVGFSHDGT